MHLGVIIDKERSEKIPEDERCQKCSGTGNEFFFMYKQCSDCGGSGHKTVPSTGDLDGNSLSQS